MAAMAAATIVEKKTREEAVGNQNKISMFWLVPQYFLVGAGEAFVYVGQLECFIREAPERMKLMSTGLFLTTLSMGFFISSLLMSLVEDTTDRAWIKNNLNKGKLDYFYWMLAVLGVLNFMVFIGFALGHEYKVQSYNEKDDEEAVGEKLEMKIQADGSAE